MSPYRAACVFSAFFTACALNLKERVVAGPPPIVPPTKEDALVAAEAAAGVSASGVLGMDGGAPVVTSALAKRAADLAYNAMSEMFGGAAAKAAVSGGTPNVTANAMNTTNSTVRLGPAKPPACAAPPRPLEKADVQMAMAPFRPPGSVGEPMPMKGGGQAWKLEDGGWSFQYPDMVARQDENGATRMAWPEANYAISYDRDGISYHNGDTVIHRDISGDVVIHQPSGTVHQEGQTIIYHWCTPNVVVYHTPTGIVYYDDEGMTFRGAGGTAHYASTGEVLYQGPGGVTRQSPDGQEITHWTESGVIYRHGDGSLTYTPEGESEPKALLPGALGPDPFPGPPMTVEDVTKLAQSAAWQPNGPAETAASLATAGSITARENQASALRAAEESEAAAQVQAAATGVPVGESQQATTPAPGGAISPVYAVPVEPVSQPMIPPLPLS